MPPGLQELLQYLTTLQQVNQELGKMEESFANIAASVDSIFDNINKAFGIQEGDLANGTDEIENENETLVKKIEKFIEKVSGFIDKITEFTKFINKLIGNEEKSFGENLEAFVEKINALIKIVGETIAGVIEILCAGIAMGFLILVMAVSAGYLILITAIAAGFLILCAALALGLSILIIVLAALSAPAVAAGVAFLVLGAGLFSVGLGLISITEGLKSIIDLLPKLLSGIQKVSSPFSDFLKLGNSITGNTKIGGFFKALIPGMATGGVVSSPTVAMVGEGRYPEAVVPLGDSPQFANMKADIANAVIQGITAMRSTRNRSGSGSGGGEIVLNVDGTKLARAVLPQLESEQKRRGYNVTLREV